MIRECALVQLGIPDDIISISILAKLSKDYWNVVDNIIMNEAIIFFPSRTLKKLRELVYMKDTRLSGVSKVKSSSKNQIVGPSAYKSEAESKSKKSDKAKQPPAHPCCPGKHNPLAFHPIWRCFNLPVEERKALRPKDPEAHATSANSDENVKDIEEVIEVLAYLNTAVEKKAPILDSGASHHMVNDLSIFSKSKDVNINIHTGSNQKISAIATGEAYISNDSGSIVKLDNVLYAPDLHRPLISLNCLFDESISLSKSYDSFKINFDNNFSLSGTIRNNLLEITNEFAMKEEFSLYLSTASSNSSIDWHARLGHPSFPYLKKLIDDAVAIDCTTCKMCKGVKLPFKGKFAPTSQVLEAIHLDLVGSLPTRSVGGAQYFLTIVDQFSGFKTIKLLKHKSETLNKFKEFVIWSENQTGHKMKRIISDNGGEFKNLFFEDFCRNRGISHQFSPPYTPENNGMAERSNQAILDKARCLFAQANLSPWYWAEAVVTATDLCNLLPSSTRNFEIPYKTFFGKDFDLSKLCCLDCMAYFLIPEEVRTNKLLPCSEKAIFLGYGDDFSTYRFIRIESKTLCTTRNVTFDETIFPSLSNESLDESSFYFNPFEVIPSEEDDNINQFHPFPNQEHVLEEPLSPSNEIIGDISPENILSYSRRGVPVESFNTTLSEDDTLTYNQVMALSNKDDWNAALVKERNNMGDYEVWDVIERTSINKPINCTWVFKIKPDSSNQSQEYKARLCVQGFKEVFGKDYNMTFAPTGKLVSLCLLITFALQRKYKFHQIDVKCAFLNAPIQERITLNPPPGIDVPSNKVLLLKKALYGLKQAPKEWHLTLSS
jgi:transposase InsO family protein